MKFRALVLNLAVLLLIIPAFAGASLIEDTEWIYGSEIKSYSFVADQTPLIYEVYLTDLEFPETFISLALTVKTSTDTVATLLAPGMTSFNANFGTTYFADVSGVAGTTQGAGLFGLLIEPTTNPVPEPATMLLFGTGLVGLVGSRLRKKKKK